MAHRHRAVALALLAVLIETTRPSGRVVLPDVVWEVSGGGQGTPAVDAESAFFLTRRNEVIAINRTSGAFEWRSELTAAELATGTRTVVSDDVVIAGGHDLVGLDRHTGRRRWTFAPEGSYGFGFYVGDLVGGHLYTGSASGELWAFSAASGHPVWRRAIGGRQTTAYAPAAAGADVVAAFTDFGPSGARGLVLVDRLTGMVRWRVSAPATRQPARPSAVAGGPVVTGEHVFVSLHDGTIHALARSNGAVAWSSVALTGEGEPGLDFRPLAAVAEVLVCGSLSGTVVGLDLQTGREIWRRRPVEASVAFSMTSSSSVVYVPYVSGVVVALQAADGRERWRLGGPGGFRWAPGVDGNDVFLAGAAAGFIRVRAETTRGRG